MGSSRRLSSRQHAAARQAAGHAALLEPHGLSATSEGEKGRNRRRRGGPAPFYPTGTPLGSQTKASSGDSRSSEPPCPGERPHGSPAPPWSPRRRGTRSCRPAPPDPSLRWRAGRMGPGAWCTAGNRGGVPRPGPLPAPRRDGARTAVAAPARCPAVREEHSGAAGCGCGCLRGSVGGGHMRTSGSSRQTPLTS